MPSSKGSAEVVTFMALLAKLKDWSDDDPESLPGPAKEDEVVMDLCDQLWRTAHFLEMNELRHRQLFSAPVNEEFLTAWRDFERRFAGVLAHIQLIDMFPELGAPKPKPPPSTIWNGRLPTTRRLNRRTRSKSRSTSPMTKRLTIRVTSPKAFGSGSRTEWRRGSG